MNKIKKYLETKGYKIINFGNTITGFMICDYSLKLELISLKKQYKIFIEINERFDTEEELIAKLDEILK